jgi:hypothetical protein
VSTIPRRIASVFAVFCGRYGDVTKMAQDREPSRPSLDREAEQVADALDGTAVQARIDELQRRLGVQRAEVQALKERLSHAVEITADQQHEFAAVAQAEGVSLSVARRLLRVVTFPLNTSITFVNTLPSAKSGAGIIKSCGVSFFARFIEFLTQSGYFLGCAVCFFNLLPNGSFDIHRFSTRRTS